MVRILIVDDEKPVGQLLKQVLEKAGYVCTYAANAEEAYQHLEAQEFELVLSDIVMPGESGLELIRNVLSGHPETAAVMVTGQDDPVIAEVALEIGVYDYITKPFEKNEVLVAVANALRRRKLDIENKVNREHLEEIIAGQTTALQESMGQWHRSIEGSIRAIALTVEMRDPYTAGHQERVALLASAIAGEMGLPKDRIEGIRIAGIIHDIGKIAVPAEILAKPGRLTEYEFGLIKTHPQMGYEILKQIEFPWPIAQIVLQHHERMDGSGYPQGLMGKDILLEAKILGLADVVEAMASHRPYRPALGLDKALEEIIKHKGILYDSAAIEACVKLIREKKVSLEIHSG
jgi:putative nucleotidyltransferase with HDIG domain